MEEECKYIVPEICGGEPKITMAECDPDNDGLPYMSCLNKYALHLPC